MAVSSLNLVGFQNFLHYPNIKIHRKILRNRQIMRLMIIIMLFSLIYFVSAKNNVKQLTESMGQEVIEIGTPIKELPMGLEEEPSAEDENDYDEKTSLKTAGNTPVTVKKDAKKVSTQTTVKKDVKIVEKIEGTNADEEEERIEKELSEIYKDTADYKSNSAEEKEVAKEKETPAPVEKVTDEETSAEDMDLDKPIERQRTNFKFQPDATDKASIERFRTSVDEISCNKRQRLEDSDETYTKDTSKASKDAFRVISNGILLITAVLSYVFICS